MKKLIVAGALILAAIVIYSFVSGNKEAGNTKSNISFYKVPLVCAAAPQIGCGSKAKPVLLSLENKNDVVTEAWLNRTGTVIAVVWKENTTPDLRTSVANAVFTENKLNVTAVSGEEEKTLMADFVNKQNWYRNTDVDKLSMEEAGVIADRLISRVNAKTTLSKEKAKNLKTEFIQAFKNRFTKNYGSAINNNEQKVVNDNKKQIADELLSIGKKYLNESEMTALKEAIGMGLRPTEKDKSKSKSCCSKDNSSDKNSEYKSELDVNAQIAGETVRTEKPLYVQVTGVKPCCIALVTKTLKTTSGVMSASYDSEKGLYVINAKEGFKLKEAQQNVVNTGKEHDKKLNLKDRPEWVLSLANASSTQGKTTEEKSCGKCCKGEGKGCCSKESSN